MIIDAETWHIKFHLGEPCIRAQFSESQLFKIQFNHFISFSQGLTLGGALSQKAKEAEKIMFGDILLFL